MNPRTNQGAIEKLYRVRLYLNAQMGWGGLDYETMRGFSAAHDLLSRIQRQF